MPLPVPVPYTKHSFKHLYRKIHLTLTIRLSGEYHTIVTSILQVRKPKHRDKNELSQDGARILLLQV